MRSSARRRLVSAALSLGLLTAVERPARADTEPGTVIGVTLVSALLIADTIFGIYDIGVVANGSLPSKPWAITEATVTIPQAVFADGLLGVFASDRVFHSQPGMLVLLFPASVFGTLSAHGIWAAGTDRIPPGVLFGVSPLIGTDATLTSFAIGRAVHGELGTRPSGILEVVLSAPQVALGGIQADHDPTNRPGWIALTAWSGALLVHGILSAFAGEWEEDPPPPPPPPPPHPVEEERPPLKVPYPYPSSMRFGPMLVTDGVARAPGLGVVGRF